MHSVWCRLSAFTNWLMRCLRLSTKDSNLRRLQRFFAKYVLDLDIIARMIFSLLPVKAPVLCSAWIAPTGSSGSSISTFLCWEITYKGIAFPLIFSLPLNVATPTGKNAKKIMERFIRLFERNASTALWQTASSSERNGQDGSTAVAYGITFEYVRISGLSAFHR